MSSPGLSVRMRDVRDIRDTFGKDSHAQRLLESLHALLVDLDRHERVEQFTEAIDGMTLSFWRDKLSIYVEGVIESERSFSPHVTMCLSKRRFLIQVIRKSDSASTHRPG